MLLHLELIGFKSFADKTILEFAPGITAIVGPNGSGKSNIVDAIRWLAGEQSVRNLRGDEMADVIFHGSAKRKSLGLAEVSLVLDNRRRLLAVDADQVQLTRRIYRDGTSEYLLNQQPARLKDFKDIFLGSGAGARGYTIIAQGRVEELLQASPQQRRELFDEAAGISRFKLRKQETLRKLAQVESHLARSQDLLQAVENQLRTCRLQAAKAQKYQEYQTRLRELRLQWTRSEDQRLQRAICQIEQHRHNAATQAEHWQQQLRQQRQSEQDEQYQQEWEEQEHDRLAQTLAEVRRRIAAEQSALRHHDHDLAELEEESIRLLRRRAEAVRRWQQLEGEQQQVEAHWRQAEAEVEAARARLQQLEESLERVRTRTQQLESELVRLREEQFEAVRAAAAARTAEQASLAQVQRFQHELQRRHSDTVQAASRRLTLQTRLDELTQADALAQTRLQEHTHLLEELSRQQQQLEQILVARHEELERLRVQHVEWHGRLQLLEEWDRTQEGVGAGVRFLLAQRQQLIASDPSHPLATHVAGLVADLLLVPREIAALVELVLGEKSQWLVVESSDVLPVLLELLPPELPGRIGLLPWQPTGASPEPSENHQTLAGLVQSPLEGLPRQLLGHVLLADDDQQVQRLRAHFPTVRIVTRDGRLWEPDGAVTAGPLRSGMGLVSRKSELRELREQVRLLQELLAQTETECRRLQQEQQQIAARFAQAQRTQGELERQAAESRQRLEQQRYILEQLEERWLAIHQETRYLEEELQRAEAAWLQSRLQAEQAEQAAEQIRGQMAVLEESLRQAEMEQDELRERCHQAHLTLSQTLAHAEQHRQRLAQIQTETRKRCIEVLDLQAAEHALRHRLLEAILTALDVRSRLAQLYAEQQHCELQLQDWNRRRELHRQAAAERRVRFLQLQQHWEDVRQQLHELDLKLQDLHAQRRHLHQRTQEELGLEPAALNDLLSSQTESPDQVDSQLILQEIEELKRKTLRLGAVNLEALEQLQNLEAEYQSRSSQHQDLVQARRSLLEIMEQLNEDSRRLFLDMLAAVRGHFQELFRKLFGGGQADIVLDDEQQVLECGIDIVARPPGKELRSLSLLSGGEKTLTAIALLLAIFRAKPSPFCILDEVDAPLDEANTVRLAALLREFLDVSQFIIVTHKKRMMAAADRLWGVTMTEQGVSRVLPLRFEDWESSARAA